MTDLICFRYKNSLVFIRSDLKVICHYMAFFIKTCLEWFNGVCMIERQSPGVICDTIKINVINISVPSVESTVIKWAQTQRGSANQYSCLHEFLGLFLEIFSFLTSDYFLISGPKSYIPEFWIRLFLAPFWILRNLKCCRLIDGCQG